MLAKESSRESSLNDRRSTRGADDYYGGAKRYFDKITNVMTVKLFSGDCYISREPNEMLVTILGSCVAACIRDTVLGVGGMNHFLLPGVESSGGGGVLDGSTRYGVNAMEQLINGILKQGGRKERMEVKIFGGGNVIKNNTKIGSRNAEFVRNFLYKEGLSIAAEDLEGNLPRRLHYYPTTGKVMLRHLRRAEDNRVVEEEKKFESTLRSKPVDGDIEMF
jgi:chemotaxis protein CheD